MYLMDTEDTVNFLPLIKYTSCHSVEQRLWRQFWLSGLTWEEGDEAELPVFSGQNPQMLLISATAHRTAIKTKKDVSEMPGMPDRTVKPYRGGAFV